jgi:hypothetical protein
MAVESMLNYVMELLILYVYTSTMSSTRQVFSSLTYLPSRVEAIFSITLRLLKVSHAVVYVKEHLFTVNI